jgi:hypothetical protein
MSTPTILLRLEVYPIRGSPVAGAPLALVLDACQIIANNARGYLTLTRPKSPSAVTLQAIFCGQGNTITASLATRTDYTRYA